MSLPNSRMLSGKAFANRFYRTLRLYAGNGSLRAWGRLPVHVVRRILDDSVPTYLCIAPTYRCQCKCPHCYSDASAGGGAEEMSTDQFKSVISQAAELGILQVNFSAGEPLLRKDIEQLIKHAHDSGLITRVNSNGLLMDRERVRRLKKAGLTQVGISIDDADPQVHDELRGVPDAFEKVAQGIRNLREAGILCQTMTCVTRRNLASGLEEIVDLGRRWGVMSTYFFFPVAVGRWDEAYDQVLTDEERASVRRLANTTGVHLELPAPSSRCILITKQMLFVSPTGEFTPCPFVHHVIGNVNQHSLKELWQRYCKGLDVDYRGECLLNDVKLRDELRTHIESVAVELQ